MYNKLSEESDYIVYNVTYKKRKKKIFIFKDKLRLGSKNYNYYDIKSFSNNSQSYSFTLKKDITKTIYTPDATEIFDIIFNNCLELSEKSKKI